MPARTAGLIDRADALYRAADECHRQHTRHARLVKDDAPDDEQLKALEAAFICDDTLATAMTAYEKGKEHGLEHADDAWWHKGNMLWHASRAFIRRHANCDGLSRRVSKGSPDRLARLTLSFDLEASSLLNLKMAADAYRAVRPEAAGE
jgi:hypothetical protein